jgi:hypothetical protein
VIFILTKIVLRELRIREALEKLFIPRVSRESPHSKLSAMHAEGIRMEFGSRSRRIAGGGSMGDSQGAGFGGHYLKNGRHFQSGLLVFV